MQQGIDFIEVWDQEYTPTHLVFGWINVTSLGLAWHDDEKRIHTGRPKKKYSSEIET